MTDDRLSDGVFINYRRDDTGWVANTVAKALRQRLGADRVFLDTSSIALGNAFARTIEDSVRHSAVLLVLIGPRWTEAPLSERLADPRDWVRREILLAKDNGLRIIPVLVDRTDVPEKRSLPEGLRFLPSLQCSQIRQSRPQDIDVLSKNITDLLPQRAGTDTCSPAVGVPRARAEIDRLLRRALPPSQQSFGNAERLVELVMALLSPEDRLVDIALARFEGRPHGSVTALITGTDIVTAEVDERFRIIAEIRLRRQEIRRVELIPTRRPIRPRTTDAILHLAAGDQVKLLGMFRAPAQRLSEHLSR
jgi:hypothetical protein